VQRRFRFILIIIEFFVLKFLLYSAEQFSLLRFYFFFIISIIIFCEYMMVKTGDLSSLYAMIGVASALIPLCLGYYFKSKAENTAGGITYDMAMLEANQNLNYEESTDAVG